MADIERLQNLERVVVNAPDEKFDMNTWSCGTLACALGHAAMDPWHIDRGLQLVLFGWSKRAVPFYRLYTGIDSAIVFYQVEEAEARKIFAPSEYSTRYWNDMRSECIRRIRLCIDSHQDRLGISWLVKV